MTNAGKSPRVFRRRFSAWLRIPRPAGSLRAAGNDFQEGTPDCATQRTVDALAEKNNGASPAQRELYNLQFRRLQQLLRIREFVRSRTWTEVWLLLHVPLSFGLLGSLVAHVVSVFFYW